MIDGFHNPYEVHSQYGGYTMVLAQKFANHCIDAAKSAGEITTNDSISIGELQVALKSVETAFSRDTSGYNYRSASEVAQKLSEQNERLQRHMYFKYICENDANKDRYLESHAAMSVMKTLHEKTDDLLQMAVNPNMPSHLRSVQTEIGWRILELCERGTDVIADASRAQSQMRTQPMPINSERNMPKEYDVFMSHASEDKESIARPLTEALEERGLRVWFDNQEIRIGDSIRRKIEEGLAQSRYGVVILSKPFISKFWTNFELDGLIERVLPVWHEISRNEIANQFPALAGIAALSTSDYSISQIANEISEKIREGNGSNVDEPIEQIAQAESGFAVFYVAPAHTQELVGEKERSFNFGMKPQDWVSVVNGNEELEYRIAGNKLRIRLDYGNQWSGEEMDAASLMSGHEPFAVTARPDGSRQRYFPAVKNISSSGSIFLQSNPSGWMVFEIL